MPTQHIQSVFQAGDTFELSPDEAWLLHEDKFGIDFESFFSYFRKRKIAYGVEIVDVRSFEPLPLVKLRDEHSFSPPQKYSFLRQSIHDLIFTP